MDDDLIAAWTRQTLSLDLPPLLGGVPSGLPVSSTQRRSWLGLAGAVLTAARAGLLPARAGDVMLDRIVAFQQSNGVMGTDGTPNGHFLLPELAAGILWGAEAPPEKVAAWKAALVKGATVMRDGIQGSVGKESTWWTNGNIEVLEATVYYLTWRVTGDDQWRAAYDNQVAFLYSPPQSGQTAGAGAVVTRAAADPNGEWQDARVYLTENGGYDPDYTQLTATFLARLYEFAGDVRVLRLLNGVVNTMVATLNPATMRFDGVGTRKTYPSGILLHTPALPMLAWSGLRPDLAALVEPSWRLVLRSVFPPDPTAVSEWYLRGYSDIVAGWARAAGVIH